MDLSQNPWVQTFLQGELIFETRFILCTVAYGICYLVGYETRRSYFAAVEKSKQKNNHPPPDPRSFQALLASRPTAISEFIHSVTISILTAGVLVVYYCFSDKQWVYHDFNLMHFWQQVCLSMSLSYFVMDFLIYCLPRGEVIFMLHHTFLLLTQYPLAHKSGASLAGAGDVEWVTWLSVVCYTAEFSTALTNIRWYLVNTLEEDWIGFNIVSALAAASWLVRTFVFTYIVLLEMIPRYPDYVEQKLIFLYATMVLVTASIAVLSFYWLLTIFWYGGGLQSFCVFQKKEPCVLNQQEGFSFTDEIRGKSNIDDSNHNRKEQSKHKNL